jgi:hypothetical protein
MKNLNLIKSLLVLVLIALSPACEDVPSPCPDGKDYEYDFELSSGGQAVVDGLQTFAQDNRFYYYKEFEATNVCRATLLTISCILTTTKDFDMGGLMLESPYLTIDGKKTTVATDKLMMGVTTCKYGWAFSDDFNLEAQTTTLVLRIGFSVPDMRDYEDDTQATRAFIREKIRELKFSVAYTKAY